MNGILFIGDLLLNTSAPGRRIDDDFLSAVLNKLQFSLDLCKEKNLVPVIVGQAFYKTFDAKVLTEVIPLLKGANAYFLPSLVDSDPKLNPGELIKKSNLGILSLTDTVNVIDSENPLIVNINGKTCGLYYSNNGKAFEKSCESNDVNILLLRHTGCDDLELVNTISDFSDINLVVNAGTRHESNEINANNLIWKNLGPSVRVHLESEENSPKVFEWNPIDSFKEYILPHNKFIMNHDVRAKNIEDQNLIQSDFAQMMKEEMIRLEQENDSDLIETELTEILVKKGSSSMIREQINLLQKEVEIT